MPPDDTLVAWILMKVKDTRRFRFINSLIDLKEGQLLRLRLYGEPTDSATTFNNVLFLEQTDNFPNVAGVGPDTRGNFLRNEGLLGFGNQNQRMNGGRKFGIRNKSSPFV